MRHARPLRIIYRTEHALALRNFADIKDPSKKPPPVIGVTAEQVENETSWVMAHQLTVPSGRTTLRNSGITRGGYLYFRDGAPTAIQK